MYYCTKSTFCRCDRHRTIHSLPSLVEAQVNPCFLLLLVYVVCNKLFWRQGQLLSLSHFVAQGWFPNPFLYISGSVSYNKYLANLDKIHGSDFLKRLHQCTKMIENCEKVLPALQMAHQCSFAHLLVKIAA